MKVNNLKYLIIGFAAAIIAGCGQDKDLGDPGLEAIAISGINVAQTPYNADASTICLLTGQQLQLNAEILPNNGVTFPEITWTSSDESKVSVDGTGKLTAVAVGEAIVRVTPAIGFGPAAATPSITVRVLDHYVYMNSVSVSGDPDLSTIDVGQSTQLSAAYTTESGEQPTFIRYTWTSSNTQVATVNGNGEVTGVGQGQAVITCTADDQNPSPNPRPSASINIEVRAVIPIQTFEIVNDDELTKLGYGQEYQIRFNVTPADATVSAIRWESDNEAAVSVSNSGKLTVNCMDGAMAIITATAGNIVRNVNVTMAQGRLCYSFADKFTPWTVGTAGAAVQSSDGIKTTIQMSNPTNEGSTKHRGDIGLVTGGSGILTLNISEYRYFAVKMRFPTALVAGSNSNGCIKLEMFDNPRTIGPNFTGGGTNANNRYAIWGGDAITPDSPNVLYFDLQAGYDGVNPTTWTTPFNLTQFKFVIADYPVAASWLYDIYWVRTFKTLEELTAFANAE